LDRDLKWIIAHRGDHSACPENTLRAFEAAALAGADMVEFDVRKLRDGTLVVFHDPAIGGHPLKELTFAAMRNEANKVELDIPTLEQVLGFCSGRLAVDVELKEPGCEQGILRAIAAARFEASDYLLTSFDSSILKNLRDLRRSGIRTGLIVEGLTPDRAVEEMESVEADWLVPEVEMLNSEAIAYFRTNGIRLLPWTVNERGDLNRLLREDAVSGLITDRTVIALELRSGLQKAAYLAKPGTLT
jgi:glycerophosphoryl diester phosphodiesterase